MLEHIINQGLDRSLNLNSVEDTEDLQEDLLEDLDLVAMEEWEAWEEWEWVE